MGKRNANAPQPTPERGESQCQVLKGRSLQPHPDVGGFDPYPAVRGFDPQRTVGVFSRTALLGNAVEERRFSAA